MNRALSIVACVVVMIGCSIGAYMLIAHSFNLSEKSECLKWQAQAEEYRQGKKDLFYLTQWQADQCEAHGILINAPIINNEE